ncbi:MarR family transcriptional regulator [Paenarthrobacter sp. GOM3]|uniref:MarR family winged helix-turn-helix transcriptional regulator n=1 Tax=Paenarthrobacter sp. GOM3 TaxID=2782567 RepID=UPI001BA60D20|nr:MarR family transcriptional regulator [Paenarthrobacter sp. GOM3]WOH17515.1 MarR family transcriptional regulator [Paenarthrobacter sp. GOM3]
MKATHDSPADSVDLLVEGWQRALPQVDASPLQIFSRIGRIAQRLDAARREAYALHNLQGWEFDVLSALRRSDPPHELTPGELIQQTLVTSGTMTNRVNRLLDRSLVERRVSDRDGRVVLVRLTGSGQAIVEAAFTTLIEKERMLIADVPSRHEELIGPLRAMLLALE